MDLAPMHALPDDVLSLVFAHLTLRAEVLVVAQVTKAFSAAVPLRVQEARAHRDFLSNVPLRISSLFSARALSEAPRVTILCTWMARDNLISRVNAFDLPYGVSVGIDAYDRHVILIRVGDEALSLYQRCRSCPALWSIGSVYLPWGGSLNSVDDIFLFREKFIPWIRGDGVSECERNGINHISGSARHSRTIG